MTLGSRTDNEAKRFRDAGLRGSKVAVVQEGDTGLLEGVQYDEIQASYPSSTTEVYTFYSSSVQVAEIEVVYTNASKKLISSARRV